MTTNILLAQQKLGTRKSDKEFKVQEYFTSYLKPGMHMGTMFMRTISITGEGFTSVTNRVSGTGDYTVQSSNRDSSTFKVLFTIDGFPPSLLNVTISDSGKTIGFSGKKLPNTEASGLVYNPTLWGSYRKFPKSGDKWTININQPWELGGVGKQLITVVYSDPGSSTFILKREGYGDGFYDNEHKEMNIKKDEESLKVTIIPGKGHWVGYTTIQHGLIVSDELMATRSLTLVSGSKRFNAVNREYIMLNTTMLPNF